MNIARHTKKRPLALASLLLVGSLAANAAYASPPGLVEVTSHSSFDATLTKVKSAVSQNGLMVLKDFNQQMMLNMVGVHAPKEVTLEIFHPKYGKAVYEANPVNFLAVPLRMLVVQSGDSAKIYYQKPSTVLEPFGLSDLGNQLDPVFNSIAESAAK
ncbi:MAG: DUF302 domain-containing protein [Rhodanobacter sp.]|nr:MAG: DUF302 domain-containing protein [Rhodanobacter sp.]TAL99644.1 MAG: DUF302 domain-containing protein [Rhodanobacter sp.]TAM40972.1 MAG: DUF302 domain-containing protein [Rhodanobacter sp.]